jgi:hypothetical protein
MRTLLIVSLMAALLGGCAGRRQVATHGNFVKDALPAGDGVVANDVVRTVGKLFPPARTCITLQHATPDAFGTSLVAALRTKGYGLAEFKPQRDPKDAAASLCKSGDLALAYVLDQPLEADIYRVTVHLNSQSVSRLYRLKDGTIVPAGYWIRKE